MLARAGNHQALNYFVKAYADADRSVAINVANNNGAILGNVADYGIIEELLALGAKRSELQPVIDPPQSFGQPCFG